jgi:hypothetical protein
MVRLIRLRSALAIALLAAGAASADGTLVNGVAEPTSAAPDAIGITSSAATVLPNMSTARTAHSATLLAGGQVLIAGGSPTFITAELYEPTQQAFKPIADMRYGRRGHTATLLSSAFVLLAGGVDQSGISLSAAELFIPASATFTLTHPMTTARAGHTATLLKTNHVLIAGGDSAGNTVELFDPATRTFTRTGTMNHPRWGHAAALLTDGRVLVTGGDQAGNTAEIFDPRTGRFSPTGSMLQSRYDHTATLLSNGFVLITGGQWYTGQLGTEALSSAEIYEPASARFFAVQPMSVGRVGHTATALADGTVLVAGGATRFAKNPMGCGPLYFYWETGSVERFNPATRQFTVEDFMSVPRSGHTATRLPTGDVLVTGGTTLVNTLCGIIARYHRVIGEFPTPTATAETIR